MPSAPMYRSALHLIVITLLFSSAACQPSKEEVTAPSQRMPSQASPLTEEQPEGALWGPVGAMKAPRLLHTATRLNDGRVLAVGGYNRSAELFDPATERWVPTGETLNTHRSGTATLLLNGQVLVASAGESGWSTPISAELYNPETGQWSATGGLLTPRVHHAAIRLLDGRVLVTGGTQGEYDVSAFAAAELYDPASGTWSETGAMSVARSHHTATLLRDGKVLVTGGTDSAGMPLRSAELFDPTAGTWTEVGEMSIPRAYHTATGLLDGRVLVVGGGGMDWQSSSSAELFDPASGEWTPMASMATPRRLHTATLLPTGHVLVVGGFHEYTGILRTAEAYEPETGVWRSAGDMEAVRYLHTATLLSNGQVLTAGGVSNEDQSSAETFAPYFETRLDSGDDWDLLRMAGVTDDTGAPFVANLYILQSEAGVEQAPLPETIRVDLADSGSAEDTAHVVSQSIVDEIALSEKQGALTPALEAIAEPLDPEGIHPSGLFKRCSDKQVSPGKTIDLSKTFKADQRNLENRPTPNEADSSIGTTSVGGNMSGTARAEVNINLRRFRLFGKCIPYGVRFENARIHGNIVVNNGVTLSATVSKTRNLWEWNLRRTLLFRLAFTVGPIPVYISFDLPMRAALDVQSSLTGKITYTGGNTISGSFDYACTFKRCDGYASFNTTASANSPTAAYSLTARVNAQLYFQAAFRASLYSPYVAYAWVGVRPSLNGDLWAYYGNDCGGDSVPRDVLAAAALDLDLNFKVEAAAGVLRKKKKWFDSDWTIFEKNFHLWFLPMGDMDVFKPVLRGPEEVPLASVAQFNIKPRSCWPYGDALEYRMDWGDGETTSPTGAPNEWITAGHTWQQTGDKSLGLTTVRDTHGRKFERTTQRSLRVVGSTGAWTSWLRRDEPSGSGDWETLSDFPSSSVCNGIAPIGIECRTVTGGIDWSRTGEVYTCSPSIGGVCVNDDQPDGECMDYEVRFLCP